jgi:crotonobetainyl-CoA:carnitine CoA-transferase CaiB-like acyl-CoA transferase
MSAPQDWTPSPATSAHPLAGALAGLRVIDFTQIAAGPLCTMLLGDMGAEVVKVEPPGGDIGRALGPPFVEGESAMFMSLNRNKRSVVLDLKTEEGRRLARALVAEADVLVESFRPGVADRLGIGYEAVTRLNPRLLYCSISAFGQHGPWSGRPGVDGVLQAVSGLMSITGAEGEPPSKLQAPVVDMVTGYQATIAVLAALRRREVGETPARLDVSLYAGALMLQQVPLAAYLASGELPVRCGSGAPYAAPNEAYETADGHILVAAYQEGRWRDFCAAVEKPGLAFDPRFATLAARVRNRPALTAALNAALRRRPTVEWLEILERADIICAPVADYRQVIASPQAAAAGLMTEMPHPRAGRVAMPGFAIGGPAAPAGLPPPLLDEHGDALRAEAGKPARAVTGESIASLPDRHREQATSAGP